MDRPGEYFTWHELTRSTAAAERRIENIPTATARNNLRRLCEDALDPIRRAVGGPVRITSGYRSDALNKAIGGSKSSAHVHGLAADIKADGLTAEELARIVHATVEDLDQVIWYAPERGGHVHVGLAGGRARHQTLHAPAAGGYVPWTP